MERALVDIRARVEHLEQRISDASSTTPTLPAGDRCLACGSARLIGRADLSIKTTAVKADVLATVESRPASVFSTFTARSPVWAVVCGDCGRAELHLDSTKSLLEAWQSRQTA
ncbi:MAG: hypothetical protein SFW67_08300 [Myxococcaceae bacterium]|nr:hypothetical protein [Myxococcaceae bacterium]